MDIQKMNHHEVITVEKIIQLQKLSYQVEADLIGFYDIPPLKESLTSLMACEETFCGCYEGEILVGLISYKCVDDCLDIHRVAVHPAHFRKGIAEKLLLFAETENPRVVKITVSTARDNLPAVKLYEKLGYHINSSRVVADSLALVSLLKIKSE